MLRESVFLIRAKVFSDLAGLCVVILFVQHWFFHPEDFPWIFINTTVWLMCARGFGLYGDLRLNPFSVEWIMFLKAFGLYALITSFITFQLLTQAVAEKRLFLLQCSFLFFLLPIQKLLLRIAFKRLRTSPGLRKRVLIVGAGKIGLHFYENYVQNHYDGYELTGFIDDTANPSLNGHYLGKTSDIESVMARHEMDEVVVTLPVSNETEIKNVVHAAEKQGKRVRIIPNYECYGKGRIRIDQLGAGSVITLHFLPLDFVDNKIFKRAFDILFSLFVIVFLLSWLFPIIALLIKIKAGGPVLFKQERWGLNNRSIVCWKFRTLEATASEVDESGQYRQVSANDSRLIPFGRFLRRKNLDEFPQFFNVLMGSMSVVGPRPHPVRLNEISKELIDGYNSRHWVKPGITGWAQVHGYRGETRKPYLMKKRVEHDVWYMENWTLWLDLQIIVQTVVNMVKGEKNAY